VLGVKLFTRVFLGKQILQTGQICLQTKTQAGVLPGIIVDLHMRNRYFLFALCFVVYYLLLQIAFGFPALVQDGFSRRVLQHITLPDFVFSLLTAWVPYMVLLRFYPAKKWLSCIGWVLAGVSLVFIMRYGITEVLTVKGNMNTLRSPVRLRTFFNQYVLYMIVYTVYGIGFYFIRYAYYQELQQKELEIQSRQSELSFLRSQVNPHFLFNTLNNIYSLVYLQSPKALETITGFSDIMRYMLYDSTKDVPLSMEVTYMEKYIGLQQLKNATPPIVLFTKSGDMEHTYLPPLLLIPFVENAFKHGQLAESGDKLELAITNENQETVFYCHNKIAHVKKDVTGGIGLKNVQRRLELLFPGKHVLEIINGPVYFTVKLKLVHD
jgi:two-component system LytT family sensor kinase